MGIVCDGLEVSHGVNVVGTKERELKRGIPGNAMPEELVGVEGGVRIPEGGKKIYINIMIAMK